MDKSIISKELLSEVLGVSVEGFELLDDKDKPFNSAFFIVDCFDNVPFISVHEVAHKCKELARKNLFSYMNIGTISETRSVLDLRTKFNFGISRGYSCRVVTLDERHQTLYTTKCFETEPEAIFKACQWIYDNDKA